MPGVVRSSEERERLLAAYGESGLSANEFAASHQLPVSTFYQWLGDARRAQRPRMVRVIRGRSKSNAVEPPSRAGLQLSVGAVSVRVEGGFDPKVLSALLDVLEARGRRVTS